MINYRQHGIEGFKKFHSTVMFERFKREAIDWDPIVIVFSDYDARLGKKFHPLALRGVRGKIEAVRHSPAKLRRSGTYSIYFQRYTFKPEHENN